MDVIAMPCKSHKIKVEDDYTNIESLSEAKILPRNLGENLKKLNGLRNALVHKYNHVEEKMILTNLHEIIGVIMDFVEFAEKIIM